LENATVTIFEITAAKTVLVTKKNILNNIIKSRNFGHKYYSGKEYHERMYNHLVYNLDKENVLRKFFAFL
jgi:hypothetical protein